MSKVKKLPQPIKELPVPEPAKAPEQMVNITLTRDEAARIVGDFIAGLRDPNWNPGMNVPLARVKVIVPPTEQTVIKEK
jgi:hypothetical protein